MIRAVRRVSAVWAGPSIGVLCALVACDLLPGEAAGPDASPHSGALDSGSKSADGDREPAADDGEVAVGGSEEHADPSRVAWHVELPSVPRSVAVTDRGTVFVLTEAGVEGFVDGKQAWKKE